MGLEEVFKTMNLLRTDKRYDVFYDLEYSNPANDELYYMILEHNPYQPVKELRSQDLYFMGFVLDGYFHFKKKLYPVKSLYVERITF